MSGKIYVQLSYEQFRSVLAAFKGIDAELSKNLNPFFGKNFDVYFADDSQSKNIKVVIMDKPKYPGHDVEISQQVGNIFGGKIKDFDPQIVDVKINYGQFNPNFLPNGELQQCAALERFSHLKADDQVQKALKKDAETRSESSEFDYEKLSLNYSAHEPRYSFNQVILPAKTLEQIERAIGILKVEHKVFDEWGLRSIIPTASSALSFYGPPGTGKSMAAEAIANKLGKRILSATYADIESKFHGEGPKMVKAIFKAAERDDAVLFLDESDSLLSKRLTNVSDGSAQAINSMRSQLMISLEQHKGIVIFATNLVVNYDKAFLSRLINIEFTMPTAVEREKIWWQHLRTDKIHVPLGPDVDITYLAANYEFCGREIKSAVKSACIATALEERDVVAQKDLIEACEITKAETLRVTSAQDYTVSKRLNEKEKESLIDIMQKKVDENAREKVEK